MKVLLFVVPLVLSGVAGEPQYAPSGWKPEGPAFELPVRPSSLDPRNQRPIKQEYLPARVAQTYGAPEAPGVDLSVQGLPTSEQQPIFQLSPLNGLQYNGPQFHNDLKDLEHRFKQSQFQNQQEIYRQFALQKQFEASQLNGAANDIQSTPQAPRQLIPRTTSKPAQSTNVIEGTTVQSTTETDLNQGEIEDNSPTPKAKTSVQVEKQNVQRYPAELFLSPIAQLGLQSTGQSGQLQGPIIIGPIQETNQKQVAAYDAQTHFAALPSVLAQQQLLQSQAQLAQVQQPQGFAPQFSLQPHYQVQPQLLPGQSQPLINQPQYLQSQQAFENTAYLVPQQKDAGLIVQSSQQQYQPFQPAIAQYQSPQTQVIPQIQAQPVILQSQVNQLQPTSDQRQADEDDTDNQGEPQLVYQSQLGVYQTRQPAVQQGFLQPQYQVAGEQQYQPQGQLQYQFPAPSPNQYYQQFYQNQLSQTPTQKVFQGQEGSLQSGFDVNQQGNDIGKSGKEDQYDNEQEDDGTTVTAVATAFGTRTQPRMFSKYGTPAQPDAPKASEDAQQQPTESDAPAAEESAVSRSPRRKSAKLRTRLPRPLFTVDQSGHLVLAQEQ